MSGTSETSPRQTSTDLHNVTFSQALADGLSHCGWLIGPTTDQSGQDRALVSHSVSRERAKALTTNATFGPLFGGSSPSAGLQACLASRLQAAMDVNGSPEYLLTWKQWDMFAGLQICALRASGRPTSGSDCGGWGTPKASMDGDSPKTVEMAERGEAEMSLMRQCHLTGWPTAAGRDGKDCSDPATWKEYRNPDGTERNRYDQLPRVAALTGPAQSGGPAATGKPGECLPGGWTTPCAEDKTQRKAKYQQGGTPLSLQAAQTEGWRTCTAEDAERGQGSRLESLNTQAAQTAGYPTARTTDGNGSKDHKEGGMALHTQAETFRLPDMAGWKLNPRFSLWLMGYPAAWACCGERAMQSSRPSRKRSSKQQKAQGRN